MYSSCKLKGKERRDRSLKRMQQPTGFIF
jgi:hypothetical protein